VLIIVKDQSLGNSDVNLSSIRKKKYLKVVVGLTMSSPRHQNF